MEHIKGTTERFSSTSPNLSNIPKSCDCRSCFNAEREEDYDIPSMTRTQIAADDAGVSAYDPL